MFFVLVFWVSVVVLYFFFLEFGEIFDNFFVVDGLCVVDFVLGVIFCVLLILSLFMMEVELVFFLFVFLDLWGLGFGYVLNIWGIDVGFEYGVILMVGEVGDDKLVCNINYNV